MKASARQLSRTVGVTVTAAVTILLAAGCMTASGQPNESLTGARPVDQERVEIREREALRFEVMRFADRFLIETAEALEPLRRSADPEIRREAQLSRQLYTAWPIDVATGPSPGLNLLDMTVFTTLSRMIVEEHWVPEVFGDPGRPLLEALERLEAAIWRIAAGHLSEQQLAALRSAIAERRAAEPDRVWIEGVRFSSFAGLVDDPALATAGESGGLFAPMRQASETAEQLRVVAERFIFYLNRAPLVLRTNAETLYVSMLGQPEISELGATTRSFARSAERLSSAVERVSGELDPETGELALRRVMDDAKETIELANEMIARLDALAVRVIGDPEQEIPPFDVGLYQDTARTVTGTATRLDELVASLEQLLASPVVAESVPQLATSVAEAGARELVDHAFRLTLILVVFAVSTSVAGMLVYRWAAARIARRT